MRPTYQPPIIDQLRRRLAALRGDARGATIIEFGLLLPILALFILGTIDFGRGLAAKFALEQAAQRAIEIASLGNRSQDYTFLRTEAATAAGVPLANVTLDQWLECTTTEGVTTRQSAFNGVCPTGQQPARYVEVRIFQDYIPNFARGPLAVGMPGVRADGSVRLHADAGVRVQ